MVSMLKLVQFQAWISEMSKPNWKQYPFSQRISILIALIRKLFFIGDFYVAEVFGQDQGIQTKTN